MLIAILLMRADMAPGVGALAQGSTAVLSTYADRPVAGYGDGLVAAQRLQPACSLSRLRHIASATRLWMTGKGA
ncbi:MAG: hypothetical protein ACJAVR_001953 [Paracoccaceae bacterium]|jgi:hypothetical protein